MSAALLSVWVGSACSVNEAKDITIKKNAEALVVASKEI
jgi:homospermidine synthase